jgi:ATP-binding cassette subfamily B protein/subfamily B ATP-binding cassette protein MsbA
MAKENTLSSGDFFAILASIGFLSDSARKTQGAFIRIQQAATAKIRISTLLTSADDKLENQLKKDKSFPKDLSLIEFKNVVVDIGEKRILDNINLQIKTGQTVALVGASGSGKTTLLNLLDLYIKPSSGLVEFDGIDSQEIDSKSLGSNMALVSQDPFLFNLSVFENLRLAKADLTEEEAVEALRLANADFVLKRPESIHSLCGERGGNFSGGERQRISIARALIKNAPVLLLDEATSALDTQSEKEVQKGLDSLKKGRTCFVVAHRISTIIDADLILVFSSGKVIQSGTHKELIDKGGLYSELCEMQYLI